MSDKPLNEKMKIAKSFHTYLVKCTNDYLEKHAEMNDREIALNAITFFFKGVVVDYLKLGLPKNIAIKSMEMLSFQISQIANEIELEKKNKLKASLTLVKD